MKLTDAPEARSRLQCRTCLESPRDSSSHPTPPLPLLESPHLDFMCYLLLSHDVSEVVSWCASQPEPEAVRLPGCSHNKHTCLQCTLPKPWRSLHIEAACPALPSPVHEFPLCMNSHLPSCGKLPRLSPGARLSLSFSSWKRRVLPAASCAHDQPTGESRAVCLLVRSMVEASICSAGAVTHSRWLLTDIHGWTSVPCSHSSHSTTFQCQVDS